MELDLINNYITVIAVTLYKDNYHDNRIITEIIKNGRILKNSNDSFSITIDNLKTFFYNIFNEELNEFNKYNSDSIINSINSIYHINSIISFYPNLKILNINISNNKNINRLYTINNNDYVLYEFQINQMIVDISDELDSENINLFNEFLREINIIDTINIEPYYIIEAQFLNNTLFKLDDFKEKYYILNDLFKKILIQRIVDDNTNIIFITDF